MKDNFQQLAALYKSTLLNNVIPFWEKHSVDWEQGGYFTCLDRQVKVYDTDKFIWLQNRQVWIFSMLYNQVVDTEGNHLCRALKQGNTANLSPLIFS